jgi:hypothetical protein
MHMQIKLLDTGWQVRNGKRGASLLREIVNWWRINIDVWTLSRHTIV